MIFCANPKAQYELHKDEIDAAILKVLESGSYILGEQVSLFEKEFAEYLGVDYAIGCASGTDALALALKALDIGPGDEVIVPSHTASPTIAAIVMTGAKPVYVDVESSFYTLDPECVERACGSATKAIIAVHLYGQAAAMDDLITIARDKDIVLIEDCAQATGASYEGAKLGSHGDISCFSFFPTKNLGAMGDGGAAVCSDQTLAERLYRLRQYGWDENRISQGPGVNSRLDELQAAVLRIKLAYLDSDNGSRIIQAGRYDQALQDMPVDCPRLRPKVKHAFHLYVIACENRDALIQHLKKDGIVAGIHYPVPAHRMPAFESDDDLPVTDNLVSRIVSLPLYPGLTGDTQEQVIASIKRFYKSEAV